MDHTHSDALVFIGATGDLAYKKIFPADPYLKSHSPVHAYDSQTWGPVEAEELTSTVGGWHNPMTSEGPASSGTP